MDETCQRGNCSSEVALLRFLKTGSKMSKILIVLLASLLFFKCNGNQKNVNTLVIETPEGIGNYLSEMLIRRGDIKNSEVVVDTKVLFPKQFFTDVKDGPANFIVAILTGYQYSLPKYWDNLLNNADKYTIDTNAQYVETYFMQMNEYKYACVAILKHKIKLYALSFEVLQWKDHDNYVLCVGDTLGVFDSVGTLLENFSKNLDPIENTETNADTERSAYSYNRNVRVKIANKTIPLFDRSVEKLTQSIKMNRINGELIPGQNNTQGTGLEMKWKALVAFINNNDCVDIKCEDIMLHNLPYKDTKAYSVVLTYGLQSKGIKYVFSCILSLIDNNWSLSDILPVEEKSTIDFKF